MISVEEALSLVLQQSRDFGTELVPVTNAPGRVLAEQVVADRDFPPFDRVMMDGIAIRAAAFAGGRRAFKVAGLQAAGQPPLTLLDEADCMEIMTGAAMPAGADAIIPYEDCRIEEGMATVHALQVRSGQNIHVKGADAAQGTTLLQSGLRITPAMIGILASAGMVQVPVRKNPRAAVVSTGDELVTIDRVPALHQIRRSNAYMLSAALAAEGLDSTRCHLPDEKEAMSLLLRDILEQHDVMLISGAVSRGRYDFLPEVLADLGMQTIFHRVAQKPGKPFLFGTFTNGRTVFACPGNPASTQLCYALYFRRWLHASLGVALVPHTAQLAIDFQFKPALSCHLPITLAFSDGVLLATPCGGGNSGDLIGLAHADAFISLPPEKEAFAAGEAYPLVMLAPFP